MKRYIEKAQLIKTILNYFGKSNSKNIENALEYRRIDNLEDLKTHYKKDTSSKAVEAFFQDYMQLPKTARSIAHG